MRKLAFTLNYPFLARQTLVALILIVALAIGRNVQGFATMSQYQLEQSIRKLAVPDASVIHLDALQPSYLLTLPDNSSSTPRWYSISFQALLPPSRFIPGAALHLSQASSEQLGLQLVDNGHTSTADTFTIGRSENYQTFSSVMEIDESTQARLIQNNPASGPLSIQNVIITPLQVASEAEARALPPVQRNEMAESVQDSHAWLAHPTATTTFHADDQLVGATITATGEAITALEFPLRVTGTGGGGGYEIQIRQGASDQGTILATHDFFLDDQTLLTNPNDSDQEERTYRIPLVLDTQPGQQYRVILSNVKTPVNPFNTVAAYQNNQQWVVETFGITHLQNNLGPDGAFLEALGEGNWRYTYESTGNFSDVLGLDGSTALAGRSLGALAFFDSQREAIISHAIGTNHLLYRFPFEYPLQEATIKVDPVQDDFEDIALSYSLDNGKTWQSVGATSNGDGVNQPQALTLNGNGTSSLLVRLDPVTADLSEQRVQAFGVKNFSLIATLKSS